MAPRAGSSSSRPAQQRVVGHGRRTRAVLAPPAERPARSGPAGRATAACAARSSAPVGSMPWARPGKRVGSGRVVVRSAARRGLAPALPVRAHAATEPVLCRRRSVAEVLGTNRHDSRLASLKCEPASNAVRPRQGVQRGGGRRATDESTRGADAAQRSNSPSFAPPTNASHSAAVKMSAGPSGFLASRTAIAVTDEGDLDAVVAVGPATGGLQPLCIAQVELESLGRHFHNRSFINISISPAAINEEPGRPDMCRWSIRYPCHSIERCRSCQRRYPFVRFHP